MKILFLTRRFYPDIGGVEKHSLEVAKELVKKKHDVIVISELCPTLHNNKLSNYQSIGKSDKGHSSEEQPAKSSYFEHFYIGNIEVFKFTLGTNEFLKKFRVWLIFLKNLKLILSSDIIHCHDVFIWYLPFRFLLPFKRVFVTFHGHEGIFPPSKKAILVRKLSEFLSFGNICVGEFIEKWYGTKADFITYGGTKISINRANSKTGKTEEKKRISIIFVGRCEEDTGVDQYAKILSLLKKNGINFSFQVLGDGSMAKKLKKFGKINGFVKDTAPYIKNSDIVFASSYLSILDSLVLKKPVIATFSNPLKEDYLKMSKMRDFITIMDKPEDGVEEVKKILNGKKIKKIEEGYLWSKNQTWENAASMYINLWKK